MQEVADNKVSMTFDLDTAIRLLIRGVLHSLRLYSQILRKRRIWQLCYRFTRCPVAMASVLIRIIFFPNEWLCLHIMQKSPVGKAKAGSSLIVTRFVDTAPLAQLARRKRGQVLWLGRRGFKSRHAPTQITCFVDNFNKQESLFVCLQKRLSLVPNQLC